jgi:hypothetical protein
MDSHHERYFLSGTIFFISFVKKIILFKNDYPTFAVDYSNFRQHDLIFFYIVYVPTLLLNAWMLLFILMLIHRSP